MTFSANYYIAIPNPIHIRKKKNVWAEDYDMKSKITINITEKKIRKKFD
tara:strand:+ start:352 stop:498 length:147 start_codon:yes stop_codon:yes gene_type:complete